MKKTAKVIGGMLLIIILFIIIHPASPINKADYWREIVSFKPIKERIVSSINYQGIKETLKDYSYKAWEEEMVYRGASFILLVLFGYWRWPEKPGRIAAWMLLVPLSYYWAINHYQYSVLYQAIIFLGGLINGSCIIYMKNKALGMLSAIALHLTVNVTVISVIYYWYF